MVELFNNTNTRASASRLLEELLNNTRFWDKRDCLNSDGRKLLNNITKQTLKMAPWLRDVVARVRREPCREKLLKFRDILCEHGIIECEG